MRSSCEALEGRRYFALGAVHQELHRPPMCLADLDGDGRAEVIVAQVGQSGFGWGLSILGVEAGGELINRGGSTIDEDAITVRVAAGDVDGDGRADVAAVVWAVDTSKPDTNVTVPKLHIFQGDGKGGFAGHLELGLPAVMDKKFPIREDVGPIRLSRIAVGDVNGDGTADIVVSDSENLAVALGQRGGVKESVSIGLGFTAASPHCLGGIGDLNGDGRPDLVLSVGEEVFFGTPDFSSGAPVMKDITKVSAITMRFGKLMVGDLNADGKADIIIGDMPNNRVQRYMNAGGGTFELSEVKAPGAADDIIVGDLDGDGADDIVALTFQGGCCKGHVTVLK